MSQTIMVMAAPGLKVAREDSSRRYIESDPFEIEPTSYYLRRLADGELIVIDAPVVKKGQL